MSTAQVNENNNVTIDLHQLSKGNYINKSRLFLILNSVILIITTIVTLLVVRYIKNRPSNITPELESNLSENQQNAVTLATTQKKDTININPFNGLPLSKVQYDSLKNRPMAIMMDNSLPAQGVQENINRADMVYEGITEWGITRFMGIFYSDQSNFRVMPIRSVRMVFLDNLMEYNDPLLYHVGGAYTPERPKINAVQKVFDSKVKSIYFYKHTFSPTFNELYDDACFQKGIPGYSCKYHFTDTLYKKATEVGYQDEKWEPNRENKWKWNFDDTKVKDSEVLATNIKYKFTTISIGYNAEWDYDAATNRYMRKTGGKKHIDQGAKEQVWANTVIVQKLKYELNLDEKNRSYGQTIGKGDAEIFMKGKEYDVTWEKECDTCRTKYKYKSTGEEFVFNPGRIWVSITRNEEPITYSDPSVTTTPTVSATTKPTKTPTLK